MLLSLLKDRLFRNLWSTVEISFLGMFLHMVACSWLMAELTGSAVMVALIQTAYSLPIVLFSVIAGAMADTLDRRRTMIASLFLSLAASAALAFAAHAGILAPWAMLGLMFAVGAGVAVFTPSWQAALGDIVPRARLPEAVSLHNVGANVMRTMGPALGGLLVARLGASQTFAIGAATYLPAVAALLFWRKGTKEPGARQGIGAAMVAAWRYLIASRPYQQLLLRVFSFCVAAIAVMALLPMVAREQIGGTALTYGLLFGGYGFGAVIGGLSLPFLRRHLEDDAIVRRCFLLSAAAMVLLAFSNVFWTAIVATLVAGACWLLVHSLQNSAMQLSTPRSMVGRMVAMFLSSAYLGLSVGSWLWGYVTELTSTRDALLIASVAMLGAYAIARRYGLPTPEQASKDDA